MAETTRCMFWLNICVGQKSSGVTCAFWIWGRKNEIGSWYARWTISSSPWPIWAFLVLYNYFVAGACIGEMVMIPAGNLESAQSESLGYVQFCARLDDDPNFANWFHRLRNGMDQVADACGIEGFLLQLHTELCRDRCWPARYSRFGPDRSRSGQS